MGYTTKNQVIEKYKAFIKILDDAKTDLQKISGYDDDVKKLKNSLIKTVENEIDSASAFAKKSLENQNWDNLTIGFFGVTNAGKSTIVETFRILFDNNRVRNNDGKIVGYGDHDFTKDYAEYKFKIDDTEFTLIDVPGIEGDEKSVQDNIYNGLSKAHIVFYVHGQDSPPDAKIVKKIKKYIGKGANVYSVYNIRGGAGNYDEPAERVTLVDARIGQCASIVEKTFKDALGDIYKGNICVQALLAMSSHAMFNKERYDLIRTQEKLLSYFGSAEKVLSFSLFWVLVNVVKSKAKNARYEIIESNAQKLHQQIRQARESFAEVETGSNNKFKNYINNINTIFDGALNNIKNGGEKVLNDNFDWFERRVCSEIDDGEDSFGWLENKLKGYIQKEFNDVIVAETQKMEKKIKEENQKIATEFTCIAVNDISINSASLPVLNYGFGDLVTDSASYFSGALIGSMICPGVGTVLGGALSLLVSIFFGQDDRRTEAKSKARKAICEAKTKTINAFKHNTMVGIENNFNTTRNTMTGKAYAAIKDLNEIKLIVNDIKEKLDTIN